MKDPNAPEQDDDGNSVVVYRTGVVYELDMVAEAMTRAGIPHFRRRESIGGLSFAMPVMPAGNPGDLYAIVVPQTWAVRAKHFIASLPVSQDAEPGFWGFRSPPKGLSSQWAWVLVVGLGIVVVWTVVCCSGRTRVSNGASCCS
jgi:hypothetical protein